MSDEVQVRASLQSILPDRIREALLRHAAAKAVEIIRKRTLAGHDVNGAPFVPYSKGYARMKAGTGRGTAVNLHLTGGMLNGLTVLSVTPTEALVGFQGSSSASSLRRIRTAKGKATSRKLRNGERATHVRSVDTSAPPVSNALKAAANNERRRFFALSPEERRQVIADAERFLRRGGSR